MLKCHPDRHVGFSGNLLLKVSCKWHLNPHDHADPSGFGFLTGHGAETVRQPPRLIFGERDHISLMPISGCDCEVALSCLQEGLGAEPGLLAASQRHPIISWTNVQLL